MDQLSSAPALLRAGRAVVVGDPKQLRHLIEFSAMRFYDHRLTLMTRHPATESPDAIDLVPVYGQRSDSGVNAREVEEVLDLVNRFGSAGKSIGIVTPFRAQADAIQRAIVDTIPLDEIRRMGLTSATVHGFQGNERDLVIASLAVDTSTTGLSFLNDPQQAGPIWPPPAGSGRSRRSSTGPASPPGPPTPSPTSETLPWPSSN